ncbi:unnamed protein product [Camellia sinensis]
MMTVTTSPAVQTKKGISWKTEACFWRILLLFQMANIILLFLDSLSKSSLRQLMDFAPIKLWRSINFLKFIRVFFDKRLILIKKGNDENSKSQAIRDMVIKSLMSSHKNVLKLIGCCLDFDILASVYEYAVGGSMELLSKRLYESEGGMAENGESSSLTWKSRLKIANDMADVVIYMHIVFSTPVLFRDLKLSTIIIDQSRVAKLLDFFLSILIPPRETQVEDKVLGTWKFIDPEYMLSGFLTEKSDVYSFGVILLELLEGKRSISSRDINQQSLRVWVKDSVEKDQFNEFVDSRILKERGGIVQEQQLQALLALAMRCIQENKEDRPKMHDITKELRRMPKSDYLSSSTQPFLRRCLIASPPQP